jgi:hypothetical protein
MRRPTALLLVVVTLFVPGSLPLPANAQVAAGKSETSLATSLSACERAAKQTFGAQAPRDLEVTLGAPSVQPGLASDSQSVLRGSGRWRGAGAVHTFSYTCNVDRGTSEALGFVMRDSTPAPAEAPAPPRASLEPDLSELSPAACESSAVVALQQRWPRVSKITFDSATRTLHQQSASRADFHGSGLALPGPGSPTTVFEFDCAIDPRDGRVLRTSLSG